MAVGSSPIAIYTKDPVALLDFTIDWTAWLLGDRITSVFWEVDSGIANSGESFSATTATIWLTSGSDGVSYYVAATITTAAGRTDKRTIKINAVNR